MRTCSGSTFLRVWSAAVCGLWGLVTAGFAVAGAGGEELETIKVTARKQAESLQSVPMSITALESADLQQRGAFDLGDVITSVPNVSFSYGTGDGRNNSRQIALRGVYGAGNVGGAGTTGFYIDETPLEQSVPVKLVDVNHIEVLRGPQGTLYGARSMGGTVKVVTNRPSFTESTYDLKSSVGFVDHGRFDYELQNTVNVPFGTSAALRGTAYYDKQSGFIDRIYGGTYAFPAGAPAFTQIRGQSVVGEVRDTDSAQSYGVQLAAAWAATDRLTVTPKVTFQRNTAQGASLTDTTPDNLVQRRAFDIREPASDRILLGSIDLDYAADWGTIFSSTSHYQRNNSETEDSSEELASPDAFGFIVQGPSGTNVEVPFAAPISREAAYYVTTEEFRVVPKRFGAFDFIGGVFYQRTRSSNAYSQNVPGISAYAQTVYGLPSPPFPTDNLFFSSTIMTIDDWAAFGELTYHVSTRLSATVGARPYSIKSDFSRLAGGLIGGSGPQQTGTQREHGVIPKVQVQYKFDEDRMLYASAAKGLRIGGNNAAPPVGFCDASLAAIGRSAQSVTEYQSDSLWSYEAGAKLQSSNHRFSLNGAAYYIDWSDILQNVHLACGFNFLANAGKARSVGGELEAAVRLAEGLTWRLGVGFTNAKITQVSPGVDAHVGDRVEQVPRFTGNTSLIYARSLSATLQGQVRADVIHVGKSFTTFDQSDILHTRPAYTQADFRFGVASSSWESGLYLRNAFNVHANFGDEKALALELAGRPRLTTNRPRTVGIDFAYHY